MKLEIYKRSISLRYVAIIFKSVQFCMITIWDYDTKYNWFFHYCVYSNLYWVTVITIVFVLCNVNKCNLT